MTALCNTGQFAKLVSVTTRPKRQGEVEGTDYYFISEEEFTALEEGEGLVQATIFKGCSYGTTVEELDRISGMGKAPIVIVEPNGIPQFEAVAKTHDYKLKTLFLTADLKILIRRYLQRMTAQDLTDRLDYHAGRLTGITEEIDWGGKWDFDMRIGNDIEGLDSIEHLAKGIKTAFYG